MPLEYTESSSDIVDASATNGISEIHLLDLINPETIQDDELISIDGILRGAGSDTITHTTIPTNCVSSSSPSLSGTTTSDLPVAVPMDVDLSSMLENQHILPTPTPVMLNPENLERNPRNPLWMAKTFIKTRFVDVRFWDLYEFQKKKYEAQRDHQEPRGQTVKQHVESQNKSRYEQFADKSGITNALGYFKSLSKKNEASGAFVFISTIGFVITLAVVGSVVVLAVVATGGAAGAMSTVGGVALI